ncbi:MAG TPA: double-cubane-cluster-containing anaerobic reductase [Deltaproteobacteria bacterium]|nr:double-cubane-cluster-containing anaerobic reductase [Deltaproteobacteria bacterium]
MVFDETYRSVLEEKVFQEARELKRAGMKVFGVYCSFTPKELITAAGAIPVSLCAGSEKPMERAEQHLPRTLCPLIKSSYGHALSDTCPYFHSADYLLADATCDGKKKMFELLGRIKPVHVLNLPQTSAGGASLDYWVKELQALVRLLESVTGNVITEERLASEIALHNAFRAKKKEVYELNTGDVPLVTGREIDAITWPTMFNCNLAERIREMDEAIAAIRSRGHDESFLVGMRRRPRILLTGCPITNKKLLDVIEECGAVVVAQENCGGLKTLTHPVPAGGKPLHALAKCYLEIPCSCMTPNASRLDLIEDIIDRYHIDGVVDLTWEACHTYNVEAFLVREHVQERCRTPYIQIRTDYSENDREQLRTRIGAFLEMMDPVGERMPAQACQ